MSTWEGFNRRRFPRVNYPCLVILRQLHNPELSDVILTHTENIGLGGLCVIIKKDLKIFTPVELELDLLDLGNHITCKGRVVWNVQRRDDESQRPLFFDVGIEFMEIVDDQQTQLRGIVERLLRKQDRQPTV